MARVRPNQPLVQSVLDRLLDNNPEVTREPPAGRHQVLRELKVAVRRDLENLLNTRSRCLPFPDHSVELKRSLVNYGIPDVTGASLSSAQDRENFVPLLEDVIRRHEPRFRKVKVVLLPGNDPQDRILRFRIDALLIAEPAPEPIVFDSELHPRTGDFEVKEVS
jgi:type VI secretion system protein ImpF